MFSALLVKWKVSVENYFYLIMYRKWFGTNKMLSDLHTKYYKMKKLAHIEKPMAQTWSPPLTVTKIHGCPYTFSFFYVRWSNIWKREKQLLMLFLHSFTFFLSVLFLQFAFLSEFSLILLFPLLYLMYTKHIISSSIIF